MDQHIIQENHQLREEIQLLKRELNQVRSSSVESQRSNNLRAYKNYRNAYSSNYCNHFLLLFKILKDSYPN